MAGHATSRGDVLVLGDYRQTLTVVRSLSRAGYRPILGRWGEAGIASDSRHVAEVWQHPPLSDDSARRFCLALSTYLASNRDVRCVFPVGEKEISFLTRHRALLPTSVEYTLPGEPIVDTCLNKIATLDLLGELNIPHAEYRIAADKSELTSAIEAIGYPCVIKPESEQTKIFGLKALVLRSSEEFAEILEKWPESAARCIVQKYFDGKRHNVYFFAKDGQLQSRVEVRIDRTDRVDGTGYAVEGVSVAPTACLSDYTAQLAERLGYSGAGCAQYLVDEERGTMTFLEINARLGANFAIAYDCGLDLPRWWMELALEGDAELPIAEGKVGRHYCWLYGDLQGFKHSLFSRETSAAELLLWPLRIIRSWAGADVHVTWDWRDPLPALKTVAGMIAGPASRAVARLHRVFRGRARPNADQIATGCTS